MKKQAIGPNTEVSRFLDGLNHPFRKEIEYLRSLILSAHALEENIKWNGPNYCFGGADRITMKIQPPKQVQLIFHRGAKTQEQPKHKLVKDDTGLLVWKENDRAIISFKSMKDIEDNKAQLLKIVHNWIEATC